MTSFISCFTFRKKSTALGNEPTSLCAFSGTFSVGVQTRDTLPSGLYPVCLRCTGKPRLRYGLPNVSKGMKQAVLWWEERGQRPEREERVFCLGPVIGATGQDEKKEEHRQIEG